ncbi:MAG: tRNA lysidine(34) synthetase TilS [Lachnospiraceae bacterium]|nr:tRNA lysidine(34) synthetase TilS [Lachnospiraceae bacterium]
MERENEDRTDNIERKVLQYIQSHKLLISGERVLAGVSGGADSICLLFMLIRLREQWEGKLGIEVFHLHHMIRGHEADQDMQYVEMLCRKLELPFHGVHCPVEQLASQQGLSVEEAGRMARYQEAERICREQKLDKIAVAHHQDDQAETILMNLFRGSGIRGMAGMQPIAGNKIRPLLVLSRKEIEYYLSERGIAFRTDSTNQDSTYTRNRIRNELLPYLEKNINAQAAGHIIQFGSYARQIDCYFQKKANILFEKFGRIDGNRVILCLESFYEEEIELFYLIRSCLERLGLGMKDIGNIHMEQIKALIQGRTGRQIDLNGQITVEKSYQDIIFRPKTLEKVCIASQEIQITDEHPSCLVTFLGAELAFTVKNRKKNQTFPKKKYTKWFDYDKIKFTLQVRTRKSGDFIVINTAGGRKKLKDYFIDCKVPRQERDQTILLADGSEIIWMIGKRINEAYKVEDGTSRILEVVCRGEAFTEE